MELDNFDSAAKEKQTLEPSAAAEQKLPDHSESAWL